MCASKHGRNRPHGRLPSSGLLTLRRQFHNAIALRKVGRFRRPRVRLYLCIWTTVKFPGHSVMPSRNQFRTQIGIRPPNPSREVCSLGLSGSGGISALSLANSRLSLSLSPTCEIG